MTFVETTPVVAPSAVQPEEIPPIKVKKKRASKHDFGDGYGRVLASRHVNGKGWVAATAVVESTVYVGPRAQVFNNAYVSGNVRLEGRSKVFGNAVVSGQVIVKQNGLIGGQAVVRDHTLLQDDTRIFGRCNVSGSTRLFNQATILETAQVNSCTLTENSTVGGAALVIRSQFSGSAKIESSAIVINSQVSGAVTVRGSAQIIGGCAIRNYHSIDMIVEGKAIIADETNVWYPIEVRGHAVLLRCRLNHGFGGLDAAPVIDGNIVLQARNFSNRAELEQFLNSLRNMTVQQLGVAASVNGNAAPNMMMPRQVNFLADNSRPRRVQRLQEAGA